ncbi:MAG: DUF3459 domain-containing protein [Myxococcales bacterium]|nr:DUF3459 domain-containing protein [Myxococcales bacterium]
MARVAAALLLTLPGIPALFTGQETGAEFEPYTSPTTPAAGSRGRSRDDTLRAWYRQLIGLRRAHPALTQGGRVPIAVRGADEVLAYERRDPVGRESLLVVLNFSERPAHVSLEIPAAGRDAGALRDLLGGRVLSVRAGRLESELPGWGVVVLAAR